MKAEGSATERLPPRGRLVLGAMGAGAVVIAVDFAALNLAIPSIEGEFNVTLDTAHWVVNAYLLAFGMTIVTAGRLADMFGRRRLFFIGAAVFAVFAALGGAAQSMGWLIGARAGMGAGAALMWPALLGITFSVLPASRAGLGGALMIGAAGLGNVAGPLIGGAISDGPGWRWIFFLSMTLVSVAAVITYREVRPSAVEPGDSGVDFVGTALLSMALLLLLLAFDEGGESSFGDPLVLAMLIANAILMAVFARHVIRKKQFALIPTDLVRNRQFRAVFAIIALASAAFFSVALYAPQFMQKILGYSPFEAGVGMLPFVVTFAAMSFLSGPIYDRIGGKAAISLGALAMAAGPLLLSTIHVGADYGSLVAGLVVTGAGVGIFYGAVTTEGVTAVDPSRSSLAGAIVRLPEAVGGAVGLAVATLIFDATSARDLEARAPKEAIPLDEGRKRSSMGSWPARKMRRRCSPKPPTPPSTRWRRSFARPSSPASRPGSGTSRRWRPWASSWPCSSSGSRRRRANRSLLLDLHHVAGLDERHRS